VLITALRDAAYLGDSSFSRLPNYSITKSHGAHGDSSPLSFRALPEHPRRRERNPEDVCRANAVSGNSLENPPWCSFVSFVVEMFDFPITAIPTVAMRACQHSAPPALPGCPTLRALFIPHKKIGRVPPDKSECHPVFCPIAFRPSKRRSVLSFDI
jgi:hypothetical protein